MAVLHLRIAQGDALLPSQPDPGAVELTDRVAAHGLDPDDLRAHIGQQHARDGRRGRPLRDIDDADTGKCPAIGIPSIRIVRCSVARGVESRTVTPGIVDSSGKITELGARGGVGKGRA